MIRINDIEFEFKKGNKISDYIKSLEDLKSKNFFVFEKDGNLYDLETTVEDGSEILLHNFESEKGRDVYWHSTSHILAMATKIFIKNLKGNEKMVKLAIGPSIENGFYYDFEFTDYKFTEENIVEIENIMQKLIDEDIPFKKVEIKKEELLKIYKEKEEKFKVELVENIDQEILTYYENYSKKYDFKFFDLCRGPHLPSSGYIKFFKLISTAGAYWRGDEKKEMLTRIYGISFPEKGMLDQFVTKIEEAKKRDHRVLGKKLGIFSIFEETGPGLVFWNTKGGMIRDIIERFWKDEHLKRGYQLVITPHISKSDLWKRSGHYDFYKENMYIFKIDEDEYVLKPMNCPGHILIYKTKIHSYKDLPVKFAELGTVYRYERSGTLHGLLRVRGFTQDDGHIFCTPDQLKEEVEKVYDFAVFMIEKFGYKKFFVELSTMDRENQSKYAGTLEEWDFAQESLKDVLIKKGVDFKEMPGEAVFYGPKIDIKLEDAIGRKWQGPTIQFDFNLPRRFDVTYIGDDNKEHYVYMIHRALLGSLERFIGGLIENYAGKFPLWLSPVQVSVLTVGENSVDYAKNICKILDSKNIRYTVDFSDEKINSKIKRSEEENVPFMLIIGKKEVEEEKLSVRMKGHGDLGKKSFEEFLKLFYENL